MTAEIETLKSLLTLAGTAGGPLVVYLLASKLPLFNRSNGKKPTHSVPCTPLQIVQRDVAEVSKSNSEQWSEIRAMSKSVSRIEGTTSTILERLPKP